jgi:hypothetical protein
VAVRVHGLPAHRGEPTVDLSEADHTGELGQVGLAQNDGAARAQLRHQGGVLRRDVVEQDLGASRGVQGRCGLDVVLEADRNPVQAPQHPPRLAPRIRGSRLGQGLGIEFEAGAQPFVMAPEAGQEVQRQVFGAQSSLFHGGLHVGDAGFGQQGIDACRLVGREALQGRLERLPVERSQTRGVRRGISRLGQRVGLTPVAEGADPPDEDRAEKSSHGGSFSE